jgi:hypothetical protein
VCVTEREKERKREREREREREISIKDLTCLRCKNELRLFIVISFYILISSAELKIKHFTSQGGPLTDSKNFFQ